MIYIYIKDRWRAKDFSQGGRQGFLYRRIVVREGSRYLPKTAGDLPPGTARVGTAPLFPLFMPLYIYNTYLYKYIHIDTNISKYLY